MAQTITIDTGDGTADAFLAGDVDAGLPGVLFFMDAIGWRLQIEEMADRIASWGYVVLAPHIFYRDGTGAELTPSGDLRTKQGREDFFAHSGVGERMKALTTDKTDADAEAWMATLREHAGEGPIGVTGYCMGARLAVRAGGAFPGTVGAVGGFHGGGLATDDPDSPHLRIADSTAEFVFGHADQDSSMPIEAVQVLEEALQAADRPHLNEIYAEAPHGYTMADTSMYNEKAAERHFTALQALLQRTVS